MNKLEVLSVIDDNVPYEDYIATTGFNELRLTVDGQEIAICTHDVLWCGSGSPWPTPPGGPWSVQYISVHPKFGECFKVNSDREGDIFIHFAKKLSYGCFILPPNAEGRNFMQSLIAHQDGLTVSQTVIDSRSDGAKTAFPIDYDNMKYLK